MIDPKKKYDQFIEMILKIFPAENMITTDEQLKGTVKFLVFAMIIEIALLILLFISTI